MIPSRLNRAPGRHTVRPSPRATVQKALRRLTPKRRAVIVLHELEGEPAARIAGLLGMAQVTVRWHLSLGRRELAKLLQEKGDQDD